MRARRCRRLSTRSRFAPGDFAALETLFASKPDEVLAWFKRLGIGCLMELDCFARLRSEQPAVAARIAFIAATLGIPVDKAS